MDMQDIVIIGAGGFGREVQWLIERINKKCKQDSGNDKWRLLGYVDDNTETGTEIDGLQVLMTVDDLAQRESSLSVVCAIGTSEVRKKVVSRISSNKTLIFPNLIDPTVQMSDRVETGKGNIICAGCILTVDISIKDFCIVNLDCTIGHDGKLGSFSTLCPGVNMSGEVEISEGVEIGTGSQIIQGKRIASGCKIGAGAVVVKDIVEPGTYVGVPARKVLWDRAK
ncbi:MAG: acetyltransferase [Clostridium sp.]|nr:acetyltransferase [Roseburia sp.]MCM1432120.1 acetyltransferase [Muribaculaceae bacterium]MCM1499502.1 acetyltransferase [Clostridium sp.]